MSEDRVNKEPSTMHQFVAGDTCHPRSKEIYDNLQMIEKGLELAGYRPDSSQPPIIEGVAGFKGDSLRLHSERLAILFGLLGGAGSGKPIGVLKNLRVCRDCRKYQIEIIVRDRIRFHQFRDGECYCVDYW